MYKNIYFGALFMIIPSGGTEETGGVTLVDEDHGAVLVGQCGNLLQGSDVSVHAEHSVGYDQTHPRRTHTLFQLGLQICNNK